MGGAWSTSGAAVTSALISGSPSGGCSSVPSDGGRTVARRRCVGGPAPHRCRRSAALPRMSPMRSPERYTGRLKPMLSCVTCQPGVRASDSSVPSGRAGVRAASIHAPRFGVERRPRPCWRRRAPQAVDQVGIQQVLRPTGRSRRYRRGLPPAVMAPGRPAGRVARPG